jgi:hypothetical protein
VGLLCVGGVGVFSRRVCGERDELGEWLPHEGALPRGTIPRCWSRDPVLGVWWGVCGDQLVCETHSRQAEQTGQPLEHRGTLVAAPTISLSLSLSLALSLTLLSLPHSHTHLPPPCLRPNSQFVSTTGRWWSSSVSTVWVRTCLETALLSGTPKTGETPVQYLEVQTISQVLGFSLTLTVTTMETTHTNTRTYRP